jgi:hypothetical protein
MIFKTSGSNEIDSFSAKPDFKINSNLPQSALLGIGKSKGSTFAITI